MKLMILDGNSVINRAFYGIRPLTTRDGLFTNAKFMGIAVAILAVTILIVQVGGEVFQTHPLSWKMWAAIIVLTSPIVIVRELYFQLFGKPKK